MSYSYKWGAFLARRQPEHNAHVAIVDAMLEDCENVLSITGSANKEGTLRNPFAASLRHEIGVETIEDNFVPEKAARIKLCMLDDYSYANNADPTNAPMWGEYLYQFIVEQTGAKGFAFYTGEGAGELRSWFGERTWKYVMPVHMRIEDVEEGLSATRVRRAIEEGDIEYVRRNCPASVVRRFDELRAIWLGVLRNPKDDFSQAEKSPAN